MPGMEPTSAVTVIQTIHTTFGALPFPGAPFLLGSHEGDEPEQVVGPFRTAESWQALEPAFLDAHASALSFFSEAAFRFFLPAFLVADLNNQLEVADPLFHLTHGFYEVSVNAPVGMQVFVLKSGKSNFINPLRYGAMTANDYARYRLSVFTRQEAAAIVAYLQHKRAQSTLNLNIDSINAALDSFWLERSQAAPLAQALSQHLADQKAYLNAILSQNPPRT